MEPNTNAPFANAEEAISWIKGLIAFGPKPGLKRMEYMMERFGNPERRLKFIHVAGTNGKGSTCAYLTRALMQAGYDVGTFTSPYLTRFTDRIQHNGVDLADEDLLNIANRLKPVADEMEGSDIGSPTMFEVTTAAALIYFATVSYPDFVVWETGLGGRLDSTNIVTPVVSVITNVGFDHTDVLGETIAEIAAEKAGIIKPGVPVVTTAEHPEALQVFRETAEQRKSKLYVLGEDFEVEVGEVQKNKQVFHFDGPFRKLPDMTLTMNGEHQVKNAAAALMTLEVLRQYYAALLDPEDLLQAFRETSWLGRLEAIELADRPGLQVLLDGAHNPEGAAALADALKKVYTYKKLHLLIGMLSTKNHKDYLQHILPIANSILFTEPDFRKKLEAEELFRVASELKAETGAAAELFCEPEWSRALEQLLDRAESGDLAVISGSLYLISDVRAQLMKLTDTDKGW
ncbi:bifunctional folylpolyglutamate synthase/dihydrofolate synthase [Paenibacillus turpanensis]|uniref:bifunctional folylpolyglutamate synthase/dihydrofolate synthase n=1 Tax=Paenibacillus turpanensis TaxID=2689078 RepID=UPI0014082801|nr:folylpolyglutamate synthase/dihydrofolate synthase family protein [Paenibacillus turpanensis]